MDSPPADPVFRALYELNQVRILLTAGRSLRELWPRFSQAMDTFIQFRIIVGDLWRPLFVGNQTVYDNLDWTRRDRAAYIWNWLKAAPLHDPWDFMTYVVFTEHFIQRQNQIYNAEWVNVRAAERRRNQIMWAMRQPQYDPNDNEFLATTDEDDTTE